MAPVALRRVRARRGDPEVWPILDEVLATPTEPLQRLGPVRAARAEAAWFAGDRDRARTEARAAYDLAFRHDHPWYAGELAYWLWKTGSLDTCPPCAARPWALQIAGDTIVAAAAWRDLGCPYESARALGESSEELSLKPALEAFEVLGARPATTAITRRLREQGARGIPRGPRPTTHAHPAGLTAREIEILRLMVAGLRNAEIAARLTLSAKTVDHHVSAVLAKLGVRTRTEAAHEATCLGLLAQDGEPIAPTWGAMCAYPIRERATVAPSIGFTAVSRTEHAQCRGTWWNERFRRGWRFPSMMRARRPA